MSFKDKLVLCGMVAVTVVLVVAGWNFFSNRAPADTGYSGAAGNLLIENYIPVIRQNGGLATNLPTSETGGQSLSGGTTIGAGGTAINRINFGVGDAVGYANTIAASSTAAIDIGLNGNPSGAGSALPGVQPGDLCDVYATTTVGTVGGLDIIASSASTTAGFCHVTVYNQTGTTFTWTSAASTSFAYQVFH